jgi:5-methyltetrahydrofolate--homocysteine methyltransferase
MDCHGIVTRGRHGVSGLLDKLELAVRDGDREAVVADVSEALEAGQSPREILADGLVPGLRQLGQMFKDGQAYLPEILISVRAMNAGLEILQPLLAGDLPPSKGVVVLGTVEGDLHDIGKRLVGMLLRGNGFHVVDLGVDVNARAFADAVAEHQADIVALSALLTTTTPQFGDVLDALTARGLRGTVRVMVGGAPVSQALADEIGADGYADDCILAVDEAERLLTCGAPEGNGV